MLWKNNACFLHTKNVAAYVLVLLKSSGPNFKNFIFDVNAEVGSKILDRLDLSLT